MKKLLQLILLATAATAALAGGDPGKTHRLACDGIVTAVAEGVKVQCGPCTPCPPNVTCPLPCPPSPDCVCNPAPCASGGGYRAFACPECSPCQEPLVHEIVRIAPFVPRGHWYVPITALYAGDPGVLAGIGYRWPSRWAIHLQVGHLWTVETGLWCDSGRCKANTGNDGTNVVALTVEVPLR